MTRCPALLFILSHKLRRCLALLLTVRLQFWNACFIIWHLSNRGRGGLFDHANQTGTRVAGAPTYKKIRSERHAVWDWDWKWIGKLSISGWVLCEVCLSNFSVSHRGEYNVQRHRQCCLWCWKCIVCVDPACLQLLLWWRELKDFWRTKL